MENPTEGDPSAGAKVARAAAVGMNLRPVDDDRLGISFDETTERGDVEASIRSMGTLSRP